MSSRREFLINFEEVLLGGYPPVLFQHPDEIGQPTPRPILETVHNLALSLFFYACAMLALYSDTLLAPLAHAVLAVPAISTGWPLAALVLLPRTDQRYNLLAGGGQSIAYLPAWSGLAIFLLTELSATPTPHLAALATTFLLALPLAKAPYTGRPVPLLFPLYLKIVLRIAARRPDTALATPSALGLTLWLPVWTATTLYHAFVLL